MSGIGKILKVVQCANCGKDVEIRHKKRLEAKVICCSKQCMNEYRVKHNPNYVRCVVCGNLFYCKPSDRCENGNCCSRKCLAEHRKTIFLGDKNPNYGNRGSLNPMWKSDEKISTYGYKLIRMPNHPFANIDGFVFEHRLIAEQNLLTDENSLVIQGQKYLRQEFVVHHKDGDRLNNAVDNLQVMTHSEHSRMHNKGSSMTRDESGRFVSKNKQ